jgi:hypothetical protein
MMIDLKHRRLCAGGYRLPATVAGLDAAFIEQCRRVSETSNKNPRLNGLQGQLIRISALKHHFLDDSAAKIATPEFSIGSQ